jgi:hypothetical protein
MRRWLDWLGRASSDGCGSWSALTHEKIANSKSRLTGIKEISEVKRTTKTTHVALDAV